MEDSSIMKEKYYDQAVACVKDFVLPAQIKLYRSCDGDLDRVYGEAVNGNGYFGKIIESGHVYELGYEKYALSGGASVSRARSTRRICRSSSLSRRIERYRLS